MFKSTNYKKTWYYMNNKGEQIYENQCNNTNL